MDGDDLVIGQRIARHRKLKRLSQQELAEKLHVSVSLLSKVETGDRTATPQLISAAARVLGVSVNDLTGQPYARSEPVHAAIPAIHGALARYDLPLPRPTPPRPLEQLRAAVDEVNRLRNAGTYSRLSVLLPDLIDELTCAAHSAQGRAREHTFHLLALAYFAAHALSYKLGYAQLATIAEDRIVWAARQSGNPLLIALGNWTRCTTFLITGGAGYAAGLELLGSTRRELDQWMGTPSSELISVYGALHLREAILAARNAQGDLAWSHVAEAMELVRRGATDSNPASLLTSGPVNSSIVACAVAVELGDAAEAVTRAEQVHIPDTFPRVRAGHHYVDLARAQLWLGQRSESLGSLLEAERLAPQQTRHHPDAHETLGVLVQLERRCPDSLLGLLDRIKRSGATPLS